MVQTGFRLKPYMLINAPTQQPLLTTLWSANLAQNATWDFRVCKIFKPVNKWVEFTLSLRSIDLSQNEPIQFREGTWSRNHVHLLVVQCALLNHIHIHFPWSWRKLSTVKLCLMNNFPHISLSLSPPPRWRKQYQPYQSISLSWFVPVSQNI